MERTIRVNELEKKERYSELLDLYGSLLSTEQLRRAQERYSLDYSLAEIAEREKISRGAVHISIKAAEDKLDCLEAKLGLSAKLKKVQEILKELENNPANTKLCEEIRRTLTNGI